ncbi:hypothetical protein ACE10Z_35910 [Bradyrhizobium sp. Pha-3]|uniref:hypothetical protein n=1 Tax=Bradyrhizobium sp. Pha-3 TaxID=208375 RepID=UPI0035D42F7E
MTTSVICNPMADFEMIGCANQLTFRVDACATCMQTQRSCGPLDQTIGAFDLARPAAQLKRGST